MCNDQPVRDKALSNTEQFRNKAPGHRSSSLPESPAFEAFHELFTGADFSNGCL
jgi:hypothetical protein